MKVPELEEKQGRNIYLSRPEYLSTILLPWSTASPYKKLLTLLTDQLQVLNFSLVQWQYTHILIIQYTKSIESRKDGLFWRCDGTGPVSEGTGRKQHIWRHLMSVVTKQARLHSLYNCRTKDFWGTLSSLLLQQAECQDQDNQRLVGWYICTCNCE